MGVCCGRLPVGPGAQPRHWVPVTRSVTRPPVTRPHHPTLSPGPRSPGPVTRPITQPRHPAPSPGPSPSPRSPSPVTWPLVTRPHHPAPSPSPVTGFLCPVTRVPTMPHPRPVHGQVTELGVSAPHHHVFMSAISSSGRPVLRGVVVPAGAGAVLPDRRAAGGLRPGPARAEQEVPELQHRWGRLQGPRPVPVPLPAGMKRAQQACSPGAARRAGSGLRPAGWGHAGQVLGPGSGSPRLLHTRGSRASTQD